MLSNIPFFIKWITIGTEADEVYIYDVIQELIYSRVSDSGIYSTASFFGNITCLTYSVLYGTYLYKLVNVQGMYALIRYPSRRSWFCSEFTRLFGITAAWTLFQVVIVFCVAAGYTKMEIGTDIIYLFLLTYLLTFLFNFALVFMINLIAMRLGSVMGFIIVYLLMLVSFIAGNVGADENPFPKIYFLPTEVPLIIWDNNSTVSFHAMIFQNRPVFISTAVLLNYIVIITIYILIVIDYWNVGLENCEYR